MEPQAAIEVTLAGQEPASSTPPRTLNAQELTELLGWIRPLILQRGAPVYLTNIQVFSDFEWRDVITHGKCTFPNCKSLGLYIHRNTREANRRILILTNQSEIREGRKITLPGYDVFIVHLPRYKAVGKDDAAGAYFAGLTGAPIIDSSRPDLSPTEIAEILDKVVNVSDVVEWAKRNAASGVDVARALVSLETKSQDESKGREIAATALTDAETEQAIQVTTDRARIIKQLLQANHGEEVWEMLAADNPDLASRLAHARLYAEREAVVKEIEANIVLELGEEYWQKLLERNRWIFGNCYVGFVEERRISIKATLDHPLIGEDGALEVVEIKKPEFNFWKKKRDGSLVKYRDKYLIPDSELQGAISQAANYILELEKKVDLKSWADDHGGIYPLKPKCLIVHGRSVSWTDEEKRDFRLLNDRLHGISVITFDHLLSRAQQALNVSA